MESRKFAILIGSSEYPASNGQLEPLPCATHDVHALESVLVNPKLGGFDKVETALDLPHHAAHRRIHEVVREAGREDQILIYFSGHGLLDAEAHLFLASANTDPELVQSSAIPAYNVRALFRETRCRRIIVILDCCYASAAQQLRIDRMFGADERTGESSFSGGYAVCIIAAGGTSGVALAAKSGTTSVMTAAMIEAIRTGAGDENHDGAITMRELYEHTRRSLEGRGHPAPQFFATGATGSLTIANVDSGAVSNELIEHIRGRIETEAQSGDVDSPTEVLRRAREILALPVEQIRNRHEALFSLLRDLTRGDITLQEMADQWYQFDETGLVDDNEPRERPEWALIDQCRRTVPDLVCPSYILDRNYHFLDWNVMFDELIAKPMGLARFRHVEDFILKLKNHRRVVERSRKLLHAGQFPVVDVEDLLYESPTYGLITFKKIAAQIGDEKGGSLAWSVNLNIVQAERSNEMWDALTRRLDADVSWSNYAKLYDRMLLKFDPYRELLEKVARLVGDAQSVIDLGAGTGNLTLELMKRRPTRELCALEANQEMIETLRAKLRKRSRPWRKNVTVLKGDLMGTLRELEASSIDCAVMMNVLYAIPDRAHCLREIYRVLKPGGTLVYSTSTKDTDLDRLFTSVRENLASKGLLKKLQTVVDCADDRNRAMSDWILRDTPQEVVSYASQAGFDVDDKDVTHGEYVGAVTLVRAVKPRYLSIDLAVHCENDGNGAEVASNSAAQAATGIFISYAHEDRKWCERIMKYLKPAEDAGKIRIWADTHIEAGEKWKPQIQTNLDQAAIALLLVTPNFLVSDYIKDVELPSMLDRWHRNDVQVVPVLVEQALIGETRCQYPDPNCGPHEIILSDIQFETFDHKPISHLDRPNQNLFMDRLAHSLLTRAAQADVQRGDESGGGIEGDPVGPTPAYQTPDAGTLVEQGRLERDAVNDLSVLA